MQQQMLPGSDVIFQVDDERDGWEGRTVAVHTDDQGNVRVIHHGPRGGTYPQFGATLIKRDQLPGLIAALAEVLAAK